MTELVIVTPAYNRGDLLQRLYNSLLKQNNYDFRWLIIDDGSTDDTRKYVQKFIKDASINVEYHYKKNGGKCSALNYAFEVVEEDTFSLIVDSDDTLLPSGVDTVKKNLEMYNEQENGAVFFLYKLTDGKKILGDKKELTTAVVSDRYQYNNIYGQHDGCIGYYSRAIKKYRYPVFEDEKYMGPTVIQFEMAQEFNTVFVPLVIGIAEYQENGITRKGRKLRVDNPKGMIYYGKLQMSPRNKLLVRFKYAISIWAYLKLGEFPKSRKINYFPDKILAIVSYLPGIILSRYWLKIKEG